MRCVIPGRSVKCVFTFRSKLNLSMTLRFCSLSQHVFVCVSVFAKAIHCLSKIGNELYLEALSEGVSLKNHVIVRKFSDTVIIAGTLARFLRGVRDPRKHLNRSKQGRFFHCVQRRGVVGNKPLRTHPPGIESLRKV